MALPTGENASPLARIHDEIDRAFQDFTSSRLWPLAEGHARAPRLDLFERDGNLVVEAELPGIQKDDVKISYSDHTVTIQGETSTQREERKGDYYRAERQFGSFYRTVPLPRPVDFARASAQFRDGVLTITLPRATEAESTRTIPISS